MNAFCNGYFKYTFLHLLLQKLIAFYDIVSKKNISFIGTDKLIKFKEWF